MARWNDIVKFMIVFLFPVYRKQHVRTSSAAPCPMGCLAFKVYLSFFSPMMSTYVPTTCVWYVRTRHNNNNKYILRGTEFIRGSVPLRIPRVELFVCFGFLGLRSTLLQRHAFCRRGFVASSLSLLFVADRVL